MEEVVFWKSKKFWFGLAVPILLIAVMCLIGTNTWICEYLFARGITRWLTHVLTQISNQIPLSIAELLVYFLPLVLVGAVIYCIIRRGWQRWRNLLVGIAAILLWGLFLFELLFVVQFGRIRLEDQLGYDTEHITAKELYETALMMREIAGTLSEYVEYTEEGYSVWPGCSSIRESNESILSYSYYERDFYALKDELDLAIYTGRVRPKAILASEPFSYTGILGIYIPFTGEANLNMSAPPFTVVLSTAHEQIHQKGYSREDEANFLAIQTCLMDYDFYVNYSGALYAFRFLYNALYQADRDLYAQLMQDTPQVLLQDLQYFNDWILSHENQVTTAVEKVNDTYLQVSGGDGTVSYSQVVKLLVGWYRAISEVTEMDA